MGLGWYDPPVGPRPDPFPGVPHMPRRIPIVLLCLIMFVAGRSSNAAEPARIGLWNGKAPVGAPGSGETEAADAFVTVHLPAGIPEGTTTPAVVICPGGGYGGLVTGPEGEGIAAWLNSHGIAGVVLEYRLPKGRPFVPLADAARAIRTVRARAKEWRIDPDKIGIAGFSAGGHLASTAATHFDGGEQNAADPVARESSRPAFAILVYPVVTMSGDGHSGSRTNLLGENPTPQLLDLFSNEKQVTKQTPPVYLAHAIDDQPVPVTNSRLFHEACQREGVPSRLLELPSGGHGLDGYKGPNWDAWQHGSLDWLASIGLAPAAATARPRRVLVWDEQQPSQKEAYDNFLGNRIVAHLEKQPGLAVRSVKLDDAEQGIGGPLLDTADTLVWWGHVRQAEVKPEAGRRVVAQIRDRGLVLVALHSAHWSTPFIEAMNERAREDLRREHAGVPADRLAIEEVPAQHYKVPARDARITPASDVRRYPDGRVELKLHLPNCCFPAYRTDGKPSFLRVKDRGHPLAAGLPESFSLPRTEMYDEPFHVPPPDQVVAEECWEDGSWFRSVMVWNLGRGKVVYIRPGHETFPVFHDPHMLRLVENACRLDAGQE